MSDEQELGITESKEYNTGEWYAEVVQKAGLANYGPEGMSGFIVTRPRAYALWERVQGFLDARFKDTGVQNAYFPLFIPESYLEREKDIVEGFDPEVAWVTQAGHDELEERLAVRPTSESIIAPYMSQWVRSHRDLPLRVNQWASVVRWEATETKPFFRTKEFLWQEGHTAHATAEAAWDETMTRLDQYESVYEDLLAIPVLRGAKPEHDKFPGANTTTTVEALMPDGKSVQGATSHDLGTSFAEAFDLTYTDEDEESQVAHTTSWGLSWRALGALIMTHSDDQGLVLPHTVAPEQVVIVPIWQADTQEKVLEYAESISEELEDAGIRVELDDRDERNPGFKFNEWELKGVPVRFEIGPNEVDDDVVTVVHRPDGETKEVAREDIAETVREEFDEVYAKLYAAAEENLEENVREADSRADILGTIGQHGGYVKAPWCGDEDCETEIKDQIAAEIVMVPLNDEEAEVHDGEDCAICGDDADETAYFAKSY
ncbi:proline--tRNA ligase [Halogeometricum borinquense]|uniref:Proline--tRNA ligase n=2 Tax=Halogeometricum borinquense TaxID=60847 RepID=E4NQW3_HALBP|nr:proline--tRNA ligase [Halogeometricum borinquense]ADQ67910.1 prolyl-tRNA synthetase [Halogeometricum borinquense DSM 11551]ELY24170.1 prolyl-tRNA ligase [Halogeometricum borinquense DSM 11551]QIB73476.1 proline--tRNA ligase [Halogeometricum borinquense]QIQ77122.1 proline--tRNA ligase [Halogeometricum borinquense]RYJ08525.1 proline--tRNA ligase [Halogeometricum borinquense]